jgi:hypothetical protein
MEIMKWEYIKENMSQEKLNELGKQGWEAFGAVESAVLMKRPCGRLTLREVEKEPEKSKNTRDTAYER